MRVQRISDFDDAENTQLQLLSLDCTGNGQEATIDALVETCKNPGQLDLSWRPDAKRSVFIFTDERPQSYTSFDATRNLELQDVVFECARNEVKVYTWTGFGDWTAYAPDTGGLAFSLFVGWQLPRPILRGELYREPRWLFRLWWWLMRWMVPPVCVAWLISGVI